MNEPVQLRKHLSDVEATRWFVEEVQPQEPALRGYLRSRYPTVDPDDIIQESYLKLFTLRTTAKIVSARAYFFAIARNTARRFLRRGQLYAPTPVSELPDSCLIRDGSDVAEITHARELFQIVTEAIDRLPSRCREIIKLVALQGLSNAEVAARLGIAESTVRVQMARGVRKCIESLRDRGEYL